MQPILQTNVFFFITAMAVVVVSSLLGVALYYLIRILQNVREVSDRLRKKSEDLAEDLDMLRSNIKQESVRIRDIADFLIRKASLFTARKERRPRRTPRHEDHTEDTVI